MAVLSRNHIHDEFRRLLTEIEERYKKARNGVTFDFKEDIEPFLEENRYLVEQVKTFKTDERFNEASREKVYDELMELLMSCHISTFSKRAYHEKMKYINVWIDHACKESLI